MKYPFHQNASVDNFGNAKTLRKVLTPAERKLWNAIRNGKLDGYKFRRQHPIGRFYLDFYCHEKKLCIEVDGTIHNLKENQEYDKSRTAELERMEIKVIRVKNKQVMSNLSWVLAEIRKHL